MRHWKSPLICATALLASCAFPESSKWHLADEGYAINAKNAEEFFFEMHVNQLKQLGGDTNSPKFRQYVAQRLKLRGRCLSGWEPLPCAEDGSCLQRTSRSVTVPGRCLP